MITVSLFSSRPQGRGNINMRFLTYTHNNILWHDLLGSAWPLISEAGCYFVQNIQFHTQMMFIKEPQAPFCWEVKFLENSYRYGEKSSSLEKQGRMDWRLLFLCVFACLLSFNWELPEELKLIYLYHSSCKICLSMAKETGRQIPAYIL